MVARYLEPKADVFYAFLRIVSGLMFTFHGLQKIFGVLSNFKPAVGTQLWFGGMIELICGLAIAVGFMTSWAAFNRQRRDGGRVHPVSLETRFWLEIFSNHKSGRAGTSVRGRLPVHRGPRRRSLEHGLLAWQRQAGELRQT